jgi:type IX secretion system PorP/SprF family membrane protein
VSVTYGWRRNFSYRGKHGIGFYAEDDRQGMFSSKATYVSYSYHLRVFTGLNIAAGIFAGVRKIGINPLLYNGNDPALNFSKSYIYLYPDIFPGMRFYTKKLFVDISVRQLYKNSVEQGSQKIGSNGSKLDPTVIFTARRRFFLGDNTWILVPAVNVQSTYKSIPYVQANAMIFYNRWIGAGASVRSTSFASAILQVRPAKNWTFGVSYDYSINRLRMAAANSVEMMIVFSPAGAGENKEFRSRKVANCPDFDF